MNNETCDFPSCNAVATTTHQFPLGKTGCVNLPMCKYHKLIVMGGRFTAKQVVNETETEKETYFEIEGPLLEVEIAEQVQAAIETVRTEKE